MKINRMMPTNIQIHDGTFMVRRYPSPPSLTRSRSSVLEPSRALDPGGPQACKMLRLSSREGHRIAFHSKRGARLG